VFCLQAASSVLNLPCRLGGETLFGKLNVGSLTGRPSEKFAAVQSVKKGYAMKLYALACCILALSAQAVRADAFLPGPDKYENSFIHTAAFTPVGEHTTEWSEKSRPDVRRYKTAAEYAIASSRARYADMDSLKKAVTQDCVVLYDKQHDAACKCAVARADWKSYAAVELAMLQEQDASLELNRLWNKTRRMETQCKLPAMPRYAF